jgi:hypothetical protein
MRNKYLDYRLSPTEEIYFLPEFFLLYLTTHLTRLTGAADV